MLTRPAGGGYDAGMGWPQTWAIIGVLGSLILGVGGIAITVLISMRSENRIAHEQIGKRIDDGLAGVNQRIDDGNTSIHARIDDGLAGVNQRIDDGNTSIRARIDDGLASVNQRIDDGLASVNQRTDDGIAGVNQRIDDGNASIHARIDDLRNLVLTLVRGASVRPAADQPDPPGPPGA